MTAKVVELVICQTCHKRIKGDEPNIQWEGHVYCDPCFDIYLELIGPRDFGEPINQ